MMMEDAMIIYKDKNVQLREMMWNEWGDLKCLQNPTNQMELDGGLFPDLCRNVGRKTDEMRW